MKLSTAIVFALTMTMAPALAQQTKKPDVTAPSGQNSGAGISGYSGNKNGPPAQQGTVGSGTANGQQGTTVQQQDPSKIQGLPGNKSGPPAKAPSR